MVDRIFYVFIAIMFISILNNLENRITPNFSDINLYKSIDFLEESLEKLYNDLF